MDNEVRYQWVRDRQSYEQLLARYTNVFPPYFMPFWLDAACGSEGWQPLYLQARDNRDVDACMLFPQYAPVAGHQTQPPFTQYLGPFFLGTGCCPKDIRAQMIDRLVVELRDLKSLNIHTPPSFDDSLPFERAGYTSSLRYTHILTVDPTQEDPLRDAANQMLRRKVRAAEREGLQTTSAKPEDLIRLAGLSLQRSGAKFVYPDRLRHLIQASLSDGSGMVYASRTPNGVPVAAAFIVAGGGSLFYCAGGQDRELSKNGHAHCLYNALNSEVRRRGIAQIDFEGSMHQGIAYYFRSFGASPQPYAAFTHGRMSLMARAQRRLHRFLSTNTV